jgi:hypothetical protein
MLVDYEVGDSTLYVGFNHPLGNSVARTSLTSSLSVVPGLEQSFWHVVLPGKSLDCSEFVHVDTPSIIYTHSSNYPKC